MESILALPSAPKWEPAIGELVVNFGQPARIIGFHHNGELILREVGGPLKWIADPAKCRPAR